jgi:hypothetical protein
MGGQFTQQNTLDRVLASSSFEFGAWRGTARQIHGQNSDRPGKRGVDAEVKQLPA